MRKKTQGFSLLELMLVLSILGILSVLAYPTYTQYLLQSHRKDALTSLTQAQLLLERCYSEHFSYAEPCKALLNLPQISAQGFYRIQLSDLDKLTYTLTAIAFGPQTKDSLCARIVVTGRGIKTAYDDQGHAQIKCWG